jgi:hypothetical protein
MRSGNAWMELEMWQNNLTVLQKYSIATALLSGIGGKDAN